MHDWREWSDDAPEVVPSIVIVLTDHYLRPELAELNCQYLSQGIPWLLVKPNGVIPWIGPLFTRDTGCWECAAQRLRANQQMEQYILQRREPNSSPILTSKSHFDGAMNLVFHWLSQYLQEWQRGNAHALEGKLFSWDLLTHKTQFHTLVKRPQCAACGDAQWQRNAPDWRPVLTARPKRFRLDGGHRIFTPQETFDRFQHHISPILGAVTDLAPALGHHHELTPSFVAGHNFSMGVDSIVFLRESLRGMSGGKGASEIQAKVSGLCEAIERYAGLCTGHEYAVRGSFQQLAPAAIHPNDCLGFSPTQFAHREAWNQSQAQSRCVLITHPFDETAEYAWTPLYSLTHDRLRYLPTAYCYYGHPEFKHSKWCAPDSNGSAAGNTFEEALLQGFFELVERDAVAIWWYNRIPRPAVPLASIPLPYVQAVAAYYASQQRDLWVLDISHDLPVTTLACLSRRTDGPCEDLLLGFGAHSDPQIALLRAITEVNQFLPSVSLRNADGSTRYLFGDDLAKTWWRTAKLSDHPYLAPHGERPWSQLVDRSRDDLKADVDDCIALCRDRDLELLVLDQTLPDIGLSVVKTVVPDLCHFWRRLGKARLYQVPVQLGWLPAPLAEDQLNPHSIFF